MDFTIVREYYIIIKNKIAQTRFDSALASIEKLLEYYPDDVLAHYYRGICYFVKENYEESAKSYTNAIKVDSTFAKAYFNLGVCFYVLGVFDEALVNIAQAMVLFEKEKDLEKKYKCYEAIRLIDKERKDSIIL